MALNLPVEDKGLIKPAFSLDFFSVTSVIVPRDGTWICVLYPSGRFNKIHYKDNSWLDISDCICWADFTHFAILED